MVDKLESLELDETTVLVWTPQQDRTWTTAPDGDYELADWANEAYLLSGQVVLASELRTFNRMDELAELFEMVAYQIPAKDYTAYVQLDDNTNAFVIIDRPFVKKFVGSNVALVEMLCRILGTTSDYQDGYDLNELETVTNDWSM